MKSPDQSALHKAAGLIHGLASLAILLASVYLAINVVGRMSVVLATGLQSCWWDFMLDWRVPVMAAVVLTWFGFVPRPASTAGRRKRVRRLLWIVGAAIAACYLSYSHSTKQHLYFPNQLGLLAYEADREYLDDPPAGVKTLNRTNGYGYRDSDWDARPAPGVIRILAIGDSFVWGQGLLDEEDVFDRQLEKHLARKAPETRWEVMNLGHGGDGLFSYFYIARKAIEFFHPGMVLIGHLGRNEWEPLDYQRLYRILHPHLFHWFAMFDINQDLKRASGRIATQCLQPDSPGYPAPEAVLADLLDLIEVARDNGVRIIYWGEEKPPVLREFPGNSHFQIVSLPEDWMGQKSFDDLFIPGDGHPTGLGNDVVSGHLAAPVLQSVGYESL